MPGLFEAVWNLVDVSRAIVPRPRPHESKDVYDEAFNRFDPQARAQPARLVLADAADRARTATETKGAEMDTRDDVRKTYAMLDSLNAKIDALTERAENAGADVRNELAEIRIKQHEARARLASMRHTGEGAWQGLKAGIAIDGTASRLSR